MTNLIWNLIFFFDLGGALALVLYALARWPWLVHRLELLFYGVSCLLVLLLAVGFVLTRIHEASWRGGAIINGIEYHDWRD